MPGFEGATAFLASIAVVFAPGAIIALEWGALRISQRSIGNAGALLAEITAFVVASTLFAATINDHSRAYRSWGVQGIGLGVIVYVLVMPIVLSITARLDHSARAPIPASAPTVVFVGLYMGRVLARAAVAALLLMLGYVLLYALYMAQEMR